MVLLDLERNFLERIFESAYNNPNVTQTLINMYGCYFRGVFYEDTHINLIYNDEYYIEIIRGDYILHAETLSRAQLSNLLRIVT